MPKGNYIGLIEPGNINLFEQPEVKNRNGSISTVDSRGFNLNGVEILLPSVTPDGRHFVKPNGDPDDDAILAEYYRTGRHLGKFNSREASNSWAKRLHEDYEAGKYRKGALGEAINLAQRGNMAGMGGGVGLAGALGTLFQLGR